jgi:hypothetical protein
MITMLMLSFIGLTFLKDFYMVEFLNNVEESYPYHIESSRLLYSHLKSASYLK